MTTTLRRWLNAILHRGLSHDTTPLPRRSDTFDHWLRDQREKADPVAWHVIDGLLDTYRLHADTGTPLNEHICTCRAIGECECYVEADRRAS
ncbi:hypothetical protein SMD44_00990 [Streptomyces alboflavus]|uniref:Uncharacterized protein n=1 Tax=Streptomyces alboflavus TaxID=67267 RepID=A0A1Z1W5C5_9ACTN|nr:hypothetical protein [Streptomyces alboflavus]ARX81592.1 hypothetical protein SMD44_00990 [Streptomyces alboflavus]